jgi:ABC-type amino acid transport substrate-binding protein
MSHHPGNTVFELIVSDFVVPYGLATTEPERQAILAEIYSQIEMASGSAGFRPPRYVFPAATSDGLPYYQMASQDAITEEIKSSIKKHFKLTPRPNDVLFGRGQPCRDFAGNVRLRTYIDNHRQHYASARSVDRRRIKQMTRESVTAVGGRFLLPFDKARPSDGCVEAPDDAIKKKVAHLYRDNPNLRQDDIEMALAHPIDEVLPVPIVHHCRTEVAQVSSSTKDAETIESTDASVKILDLVSITSSSDQSTATTASSQVSFTPLTAKFKAFIFKWKAILVCSTVVVVAIAAGISLASIPSKDEARLSTLQMIHRRGKLICGITNQIGYSSQNISTGLWVGFEVDICRAQGAAIFGKDRFYPLSPKASEPVEYVALTPSERFHALKNKTVDILLAVTSQTMERIVHELKTNSGYTFSTPYLVNEVAFAGHPKDLACLENGDSNSTNLGLCNDLKICILGASTHQNILLAQEFDPASIVTASDIDDFYKSFLNEDCNILIGEKFDLAQQHLSSRGYTDSYQLGAEVLAKEYISLVTRDGDAEFSDFCNWII